MKPSEIDPALLAEAESLTANFQIEVAELRASQKQLRFQQCFFDRQDPTGRRVDIFAALGGNRSGKSYVCGWLCFAKFLRDNAKAGDWFWCVGQTLDRSIGGQQKELWRALPRWMFDSQRWDEKLGFGAHRKIVLPTKDGGRCLVEFRSGDQDPSTFEQAKLTGLWCDERLSETIYNRILPRIVDKDGWVLYSDIPEQWWQFERLKEAPPSAGVYFQHMTMYDNEHNLPDGAIDKASVRMTQDEQKQRISGEFVVMEGVVYKEFIDAIKPNGHLVKPFAIPEDWPKFRMLDYGGSAPTACLWAAIAPNEHIYLYREYYDRGQSILKNARAILLAGGAHVEEIQHHSGRGEGGLQSWIELKATGGEDYEQTLIDPCAFNVSPANTLNIADQYRDAGIEAVGWPRVNEMGEHAMVQKVKYRYENRTIWVFESLVNFRRESRSWKYRTDKDGKPLAADAFENDNNHLLDGLKGFIAINPTHQGQRIRVTSSISKPDSGQTRITMRDNERRRHNSI